MPPFLPAARGRRYLFAVLLLAAGALALAACGGSGPAATPTPKPKPATSSPSPSPSPPPSPTPAPPQTTYRFYYREAGDSQDTIWRVDPANPGTRQQIVTVKHRQGWAITASLSPDQRLLAYVSMPEQATDAASQGELYLMDLQTQQPKLVTGQVDLTFQPLWSPDSKLLWARRLANFGNQVLVLRVKVPMLVQPRGEPTPTPSPSPEPSATPEPPEDPVQVVLQESTGRVLTFVPVGFADDKRSMLVVQVQGGTGDGSVLAQFGPATWDALAQDEAQQRQIQQAWNDAINAAIAANQPTPSPSPTPDPHIKLVATLTDQIAHDPDLSPDAHKLAFTAQQLVNGQFVSQAMVTDIVSTNTTPLPAQGLPDGDALQPVWAPDSAKVTVGIIPSAGGHGAVALVPLGGGTPQILPPPAAGFDVPQSWSPDSNYLAVVTYSGTSPADPGKPVLEFVCPAGPRTSMPAGGGVQALGWFGPQPPPPS